MMKSRLVIETIDQSYYTDTYGHGHASEQSSLWVTASALPKSPGHPFYTRLDALLETHAFDRFVETCVAVSTRR